MGVCLHECVHMCRRVRACACVYMHVHCADACMHVLACCMYLRARTPVARVRAHECMCGCVCACACACPARAFTESRSGRGRWLLGNPIVLAYDIRCFCLARCIWHLEVWEGEKGQIWCATSHSTGGSSVEACIISCILILQTSACEHL